ncbi:MAG: hypothetical protein LC795_16255 [Acidobacteria bacterium]|nr:hypothetical protein [Acidobacteriota bacterium]
MSAASSFRPAPRRPRQFLTEAVVLTALGGISGLTVGEAASLLMSASSPPPAFVPVWAVLVGVGISATVGIVFGLRPAWKAARHDPIEALRHEWRGRKLLSK